MTQARAELSIGTRMPGLNKHADWEPAPDAHPALDSGAVHVWMMDGMDALDRIDNAMSVLSEEECTRAAAYGSEKARAVFVACRGALRLLLGRYAGIRAEELVFAANVHGKPNVAGPDTARCIHFNVSHSSNRALLAFSRSGPVGVDIERVDRTSDPLAFAKRFFSPAEDAAILATLNADRAALFARFWTRREAWFKALGTGVEFPLSAFDATFPEGGSEDVREGVDADGVMRKWRVMDLEVGGGFAGAVVTEYTLHGLRKFCATWPRV